MARERNVRTVGERVRQRRDELGLTQRELAAPGVSYAYISRIEAGARNPSIKALRKLAPKLKTTVAWLETGEEGAAIALARLTLEHRGQALPPYALTLARRILDDRS